MARAKRKVYLAGGFHSGWQEQACRHLAGFQVLDPSMHNLDDPIAYTEWDLRAVRECDVVLANMESSNPGGYALAMEIGFAKALGKEVLFVDQIAEPNRKRHFEMIRQASDYVFATLADALEFLASRELSIYGKNE